MALEAEFSSALPQILPGYLNKPLKVRSKMGCRQLQRGGGRTGIWKKFTHKHFTFLVIKIGGAPKEQTLKDPTSQVQFLHLLKGIKTHLPSPRSIWTVSVQRDWRRGSSQLCYSCINVQKLFWKLCVRRSYPYHCSWGIHQDVPKWVLVHTRNAFYSPNIIPR